MNNNIQDAIQQADLLMKEGKYKSAWNLLLPYKSDPAARKRLAWLAQKRQQASQSEKVVNIEASSQPRFHLYLLFAIVIILVIGSLAIYRLKQQTPVSSTQGTDNTAVAAAPTENIAVTLSIVLNPTETEIPPTEDSQEVSLQQKLRDWLTSVQGVTQVLSFDVDIPGDEPPLVYVELVVNSGYDDTKIPDLIVKKLNDELKTTKYSDFAVIMNDGSTTTEYDYDSAGSAWNQTVLASTPVQAD
jgi:hypothetical protein